MIGYRNGVVRRKDVVRMCGFEEDRYDTSASCEWLDATPLVPSGRNQPLGFPSNVLSTDVKMNKTEPGISAI